MKTSNTREGKRKGRKGSRKKRKQEGEEIKKQQDKKNKKPTGTKDLKHVFESIPPVYSDDLWE